jgi:hypothetical protein
MDGGLWRFGRARRHGYRTRRRGRSCLLFLLKSLQNVTWLGDVREVNFGPDFVWPGTRGTRGDPLPVIAGVEVLAHFFRFFDGDGTGMRFLFGDANLRQNIEDRLALDFQFPGQIVDSNLRGVYHPSFFFLRVPRYVFIATSRS